MIQGCLLRTQKCLVGRSHEVSSKVPARTRCRPSPGLPVLKSQQPHSGQTQRIFTRPLSAMASSGRGSSPVRRKPAIRRAAGPCLAAQIGSADGQEPIARLSAILRCAMNSILVGMVREAKGSSQRSRAPQFISDVSGSDAARIHRRKAGCSFWKCISGLTSINLKPSCLRSPHRGVTAPLLAAVEQNTRR